MRTTLLGLLFALTLGCSSPGNLGTRAPTHKEPYTLAPPTPILSPLSTVAPTGHGRPYTAEMIAVELLDVSYDFPPELQTEFIAAALADRIWTHDGRPYREVWITGSCNDGDRRQCDLTVSGLPAFAPTREREDDYFFAVDLGSGMIRPTTEPGGRGLPPELVPQIEALARALDTDGRLEGMQLRNVRWLPPPPDDAYMLDFGNGGLEGDPRTLVTLDRPNERIISMEGLGLLRVSERLGR